MQKEVSNKGIVSKCACGRRLTSTSTRKWSQTDQNNSMGPMQMMISSLRTLNTIKATWILHWVSPRLVTADPAGRPNSLPYVGLCTFHIYPETVTVGPGRRPNSLLHTGVCTVLVVSFSLAHKKSKSTWGWPFKFQWSILSPTFEPHQVVVLLLFSIIIFGSQTWGNWLSAVKRLMAFLVSLTKLMLPIAI